MGIRAYGEIHELSPQARSRVFFSAEVVTDVEWGRSFFMTFDRVIAK